MKILIVEDHPELAQNIFQFLSKEGIVCELCATAQQAEDRLLGFEYDCIVLDIMLPDGNGLDILRFIKRNKIQSCVLIISAKNSLDDKITGLEIGADDYLTKPFHLSELLARLRALYRRNHLGGDNVVTFNEISINTTTYEVRVNQQTLDLTKKEFDLLVYFLANKNRVITRQSIAEHLWGDYTDTLSNFDFVYQHVKNLRKKISNFGGNDYISTVYGLGYKFDTNAK